MNDRQSERVETVLSCADLAANLDFFVGAGFRLESIYPADDPRVARLWGHGARLCLQRGEDRGGVLRLLGREGAPLVAPNGTRLEFLGEQLALPAFPAPELVVADAAGPWVEGRAGMLYRDLIPGRCGGRLIASRIRIESGGKVPDYVHHHEVAAQLIYCRAGWVRVVYEDQGPPFELRPGDCVLQPPGIRHRVLECSDGLEVVEVSSPAEHVTHVDHDLELPTTSLQPERRFGGQRFVRHQVSRAGWAEGVAGWSGWRARETGIGAATEGAMDVVVRRPGSGFEAFDEGPQVRLWSVLGGVAELGVAGRRWGLGADAACVVPPGVPARWRPLSTDCELLEVRLPAVPTSLRDAVRKS